MEQTLNLLLAAEVLKLATQYQQNGDPSGMDALVERAYLDLIAVGRKMQALDRDTKYTRSLADFEKMRLG